MKIRIEPENADEAAALAEAMGPVGATLRRDGHVPVMVVASGGPVAVIERAELELCYSASVAFKPARRAPGELRAGERKERR